MIKHGIFKRNRLLTERQTALLAELRTILERLTEALERFGSNVAPSDLRTIRDTLEHLDELFLLVIAGEFNSGKSSFINALLGAPVLPEGVTPTTDRITLLRYGDSPQEELHEAFLVERTYPADVLRQIIIVDTPGTNAVIRRHEELTRDFIPRADLVLFTTSSDRPFTESERAFLSLIKDWGKKIVLILNKIDILDEHEVEQVLAFVRENARDLLGTTPEIFPVSARQAWRARTNDHIEENIWETSRFGAVERYIIDTLDEETRVRLKLLSPLGVAQRLTQTYLSATEERLDTLREDFLTIDNIEQQLGLFRDDLNTDVQYHLKEIDSILRDLEDRGIQFFDETIRIGRLPDLIRSERTRAAFEEEVVGDVNQQIEQRVQTLIDWMIEKDLRLWQSVMDYINRRRAPQHYDQLIGEIGGAFDYNRGALLESVGRTANRVVAGYDKKQESQALADEVRASIAATAITQAGAVGLGALLLSVFHVIWLDVTGILAAAVVAVGGFYLLPAKRRQAKRAFRNRIAELRTQLAQSIQQQFERELDRSLARIREAIAPYTRFVRAQREQLTDLQRGLSDIDVAIERLRTDIEA
jgi:GTP-binding protein EngB required for normal cell division